VRALYLRAADSLKNRRIFNFRYTGRKKKEQVMPDPKSNDKPIGSSMAFESFAAANWIRILRKPLE